MRINLIFTKIFNFHNIFQMSLKNCKIALSGFSENSKVAKCEFSQIQLNQALGTDGNLRLPMYSTYEAANNNH